ncbi:MAG: hypothetical protein HRU09_08285 [Oligoflexales bacterium]|nr:hypothetical protein [Oligoflexales bacterium]
MIINISSLSFLAALLIACQSTHLVLETSQIRELTKCPITLEDARKNLLKRGYSIDSQGADYFSTDFRKSEFESLKGFITGETLQEYYRRFIVYSFDGESINYRFQYQVYRLGDPVIRLANPSFTFDKLAQYQKIRGEVCGSLEPRLKQSSELLPN